MTEINPNETPNEGALTLEVRAHAAGFVTDADGNHISGDRPETVDQEDQESKK